MRAEDNYYFVSDFTVMEAEILMLENCSGRHCLLCAIRQHLIALTYDMTQLFLLLSP